MCGIAGFVNPPSVQADKDIITKMAGKIRHRGPDHSGVWLHKNVALGHTRLSVIDLYSGDQPMSFGEGGPMITYNGEIYNFHELRGELQKKGYHFRTQSDTEVLLASYLHWGRECLGRLNGMFSFAIYDPGNNKLFLARDRMGKKPLYYGVFQEIFLFASELKALLQHPECRPILDRQALLKYLVFEYVPAPDSIVAGVKKLPAGHFLEFDLKNHEVSRPQCYWDCDYRPHPEYASDFEAARREFLEIFDRAVKRRLVSDVPLGVFLSGGIDSSAVVAVASRYFDAGKLKTFSIGFEEKSYDESCFIQKVSGHFKTDHCHEVLTPARLQEVFPALMERLDEPFADPSIIPTYFMSQFTKRHVTVVLGGDGGDELLAGYDPFLAIAPANLWRRIPEFVRGLVVRAARRLPVSERNISLDFKINRFLRGADSPAVARLALWMGAFSVRELAGVLSDAFLRGLDISQESVLAPCFRSSQKLSFKERAGITGATRFFSKIYLPDDILVKVDRASMMHSLEVRSPFMDRELVEFTNGLPMDFKLRRFTRKYLLKKAMDGLLPREIVDRKKKGFGIPVAAWLKASLRPMMKEYLHPDRLKAQGIFNPHYVSRLITEHLSGHRNHGKSLWTLLVFQHWLKNWMPEVEWQ